MPRGVWPRLVLVVAFQLFGPTWLDAADRSRPVLRIAYFITTDRQPEPDYRGRLERVLSEVRRLYREGMRKPSGGGDGWHSKRVQ